MFKDDVVWEYVCAKIPKKSTGSIGDIFLLLEYAVLDLLAKASQCNEMMAREVLSHSVKRIGATWAMAHGEQRRASMVRFSLSEYLKLLDWSKCIRWY